MAQKTQQEIFLEKLRYEELCIKTSQEITELTEKIKNLNEMKSLYEQYIENLETMIQDK